MLHTCSGNIETCIEDVFEKLEHICSWEKTLALENKNALNPRDVELVLVELDENGNELRKTTDQEIIIDILKLDGREQTVPFRIEIHNQVPKPFYCAMFYLSESYAVHRMYNEEIPGNASVIAMEHTPNGKPYAFNLNGKNQSTDIFKLIVSQEKINDALLVQKPIKIGERLTHQLEKGIGYEEESDFVNESFNDWFTICLLYTSPSPRDRQKSRMPSSA